MSEKRLLLIGDMVWGMADPVTPYVGQIVDPSSSVPSQTAAMEIASASAGAGGCVMTINGTPVAHSGCLSNATPPLPQTKPLTTCPSITLNGKPVLLELGQFVPPSPAGSLSTTSVSQQGVWISKGVSGPEHADANGAASAAGARAPGQPPIRTDFGAPTAEQRMASRTSSARLADLVPPEYAHLVGDPVDVATGAVVSRHIDDRAPGHRLEFERHYVSRRCHRRGVLGWGWSHNFEQSIWLEPGRVVLSVHGRQIEFDTFDLLDQVARAGSVLRDATGRFVLTAHGRNAWELFDGTTTRAFLPMPGTSPEDKDRGLSLLSTWARPGHPLVELHYDDQARLSSVRCDGHAVFALGYTRDGWLASLNDRVARYEHSAAGDLIEVRDVDDNARLYEYASHLLVRETNRRGTAFYYGYDGHDAAARCVRTWGDDGRLHRLLSYESASTQVTDSHGERTSYALSPLGLVTAVTRPDGTSVRYGYDDALRLTSVTSDTGRALDHLDEAGRIVKHREPCGATWQMEYDDNGLLVGGTDPVGGRWVFGYDRRGLLTQVQDPERHVYRMEYAQGRLSKLIDPLGRVVEFELGGIDEVLAIRAPWQPGVEYEYDPAGRLSRAVAQSGEESRWYYDAHGRLVGAMQGGVLTQWRRDPEGAVVRVQREDSIESFVRDGHGRLQRRHGDDHDVQYHYDTEDRCLAAVSRTGPRVEFRHDVVGRVVRYTVDGQHETHVVRDPDSGFIASLRTELGSVAMTWDAAGRLTACEDERGARAYSYRADGLLASFSTPEHACVVSRNTLGVVVEQTHHDDVERVITSKDVDHRGNRYGVEVSEGPSLFYLWAAAGTLERIGLVGDVPFEIDFEIGPDASRGVVTQGTGRAEYRNLAREWQAPVRHPGPGVRCDALLRPLQDREGAPLLWDEGRVLCEGSAVHVHALPADQHLGTVRDEAFVFTVDEEEADAVRSGTDALVDACAFAPQKISFPLSPETFLRHTFARRVWNEVPRPVPGRAPWDPDTWVPEVVEPSVGSIRLDQQALLRWLTPFPAPRLRVRSEA